MAMPDKTTSSFKHHGLSINPIGDGGEGDFGWATPGPPPDPDLNSPFSFSMAGRYSINQTQDATSQFLHTKSVSAGGAWVYQDWSKSGEVYATVRQIGTDKDGAPIYATFDKDGKLTGYGLGTADGGAFYTDTEGHIISAMGAPQLVARLLPLNLHDGKLPRLDDAHQA